MPIRADAVQAGPGGDSLHLGGTPDPDLTEAMNVAQLDAVIYRIATAMALPVDFICAPCRNCGHVKSKHAPDDRCLFGTLSYVPEASAPMVDIRTILASNSVKDPNEI